MFELKPIVRHVLLACGGVSVLAFGPAVSLAQQPSTQERVTITGSNIRRTDTETVAPVQIITREELQSSGKATVAEVLRSIPGNTGGSFSESFSNSFAPGASGISLRGLGQKTTLVLINGRRVSGYGFAQNLQDTFVDLNSIPLSAVERVEVLKDGASAIYGSDAIAGVVNIILRRDFKGFEVAAEAGFFDSKKDYRASIGVGFGDLGANKFNVFGVLDYYKRDELLLSDTKFGADRDYRGEQGGRNFQSLTAGGVWTGVPGSANANDRRAIAECSRWGRVVNAADALNLGFNLLPAQQLPLNTWCLVDINRVLSALPGTERIGFLSRATADFTPRVQGYVELGLSRNETEQTFTPPFFAGTTGLQQTPQGLRPFTYNITFAPGVAGNPLSTNARFIGNLYDLGTRDLEIKSDDLRGLAGLKYGFGSWEFDSAIGHSKNEITQNNINRITLSGTSAVFGVPTSPQPPVPVSNASNCNLNAPSTTRAACSAMLINFPRESTSELTFVDTKANTEIGQLPGGPVGFATGAEYRNEKINDRPDPNATSGNVLGQGITATDGSRHQFAVFGELALPLTRALEVQAALRNDAYSDFGTALTPKLGLKLKVAPELLIRANWGRGFRAPTLPEISPSVATFFVQVNDPVTGALGQQISGVFAGNPGLQAEKSRSATLGFVWEPSSNVNISVDAYEINWTNIVGSDNFQDIVDLDAQTRNAMTCAGGDPRVIRDPNAAVPCTIVTVLNNFRNLEKVFTRGVDIDLRHDLRTTIGRFRTRLIGSYVDEFEEDGVEFAGTNGGNIATIPRWKHRLSIEYNRGPLTITPAYNYVHRYKQCGLTLIRCQGTSTFYTGTFGQTGTYPVKVPRYETYDLFARYDITPKFTISASVVNLTDEAPPYDPGFSATFLYDFSQHDIRGRQFRIGASYKF